MSDAIPHLVAIGDIKKIFGYPDDTQTVNQWRLRGVLPEPVRVYGKTPVWRYDEIIQWAERTGRVVKNRLTDPYAK